MTKLNRFYFWFNLFFINKFFKLKIVILDVVEHFLVIKFMSDENPDDDSVAVLKKQNEMRVHDVEREVKRPHFMEHWVPDVQNYWVQARIEKNCPEIVADVIHVNHKVNETQ